jgi:hypothetical protein
VYCEMQRVKVELYSWSESTASNPATTTFCALLFICQIVVRVMKHVHFNEKNQADPCADSCSLMTNEL